MKKPQGVDHETKGSDMLQKHLLKKKINQVYILVNKPKLLTIGQPQSANIQSENKGNITERK